MSNLHLSRKKIAEDLYSSLHANRNKDMRRAGTDAALKKRIRTNIDRAEAAVLRAVREQLERNNADVKRAHNAARDAAEKVHAARRDAEALATLVSKGAKAVTAVNKLIRLAKLA